MPSLEELKKEMRCEYKHRRCVLSQPEWECMSEAIRAGLIQSRLYGEADVLWTYVSAKDNEVDTHAIIDHALAADKRVFIPVTTAAGKDLRWSRLHDLRDLERGHFGLFEPRADRVDWVCPSDEGVCLVPGIVFTRTGFRLGYGGGYYDRFLADFRGISVGLAFEMQIAHHLPLDIHDRPVQYVLTEAGWYQAAITPE